MLQLLPLASADEDFDLGPFWWPLLQKGTPQRVGSEDKIGSSLSLEDDEDEERVLNAEVSDQGISRASTIRRRACIIKVTLEHTCTLAAEWLSHMRFSVSSTQNMAGVVRMRAYRKRAVTKIAWALGPGGPAIGLKLYSTLQKSWPAVRGAPKYLHSVDNMPLESSSALIDNFSGQGMVAPF